MICLLSLVCSRGLSVEFGLLWGSVGSVRSVLEVGLLCQSVLGFCLLDLSCSRGLSAHFGPFSGSACSVRSVLGSVCSFGSFLRGLSVQFDQFSGSVGSVCFRGLSVQFGVFSRSVVSVQSVLWVQLENLHRLGFLRTE